MDLYGSQITKLIEELSALPGVGAKSAQRLAFHIINMPKERVEQLAQTMVNARGNVRYCSSAMRLRIRSSARCAAVQSVTIRSLW